ncbi:MAG TPA: DnaJ domain-containing protein [Terracidiphilus sp.]|nr:DnaJ domain-containing protein [Terracidiphilus sp.]
MACACDKCVAHATLLGLGRGATTRAAIHKAYRRAAKSWHPDRFRTEKTRADAEERFKLIQVAFRELVEHNPEGWSDPTPNVPEEFIAAPPGNRVAEPKLEFGGARGCYVGAKIPARAVDMIYEMIGSQGSALALVDLSGRRAREFSQFLIVATHGLIARDALQIVSLVSYADVGELRLFDRRTDAGTEWLQKMLWKLADSGPMFALEILRRDGSLFCAVDNPIEDRVKTALYRFVQEKKQQQQRN